MINKKETMNWGILSFLYIRLFVGLILMFYPITINELVKNIIITIGALIVLTSGIEVKFNHLLKSVKK